MTETDNVTDWTKLREFAAIDLLRSFVLSWRVEAETLYIDVDLYLTPEHPFFEKPRPAEKVCIRPAIIEFPVCEAIETDNAANAESSKSVAEKLGHGAISGFCRLGDGRFEIKGVFGDVRIDAERPLLRLKNL